MKAPEEELPDLRRDAGQGKDRWFCYVLECADGTFYTGITRSLDQRLSMHNRGLASKYTRGRLPVRLVYAEPHQNRSSASQREIQVKKMSRTQKRKLGSCESSSGQGLCPFCAHVQLIRAHSSSLQRK